MICDTCLGLLSAATNLTHPTVVSWVVSSLAVVGEGVDGLVGGFVQTNGFGSGFRPVEPFPQVGRELGDAVVCATVRLATSLLGIGQGHGRRLRCGHVHTQGRPRIYDSGDCASSTRPVITLLKNP
jgi:hypothetical protein